MTGNMKELRCCWRCGSLAGMSSASIHRVRGRIEKIFGTWKRSYRLRRIRWIGIAKATAQVHLTAIAYNLKRTLTLTAKPA